uniref:General secretion pathway protein D n=1 Tax=Candidatus Kentrum sp. FM TaxID=2126340 RepID=A0A450TPE2_9GAMM|nr:MAG: general secretion pathway protein D [Candidatus Kentron sp. FM]VFJ69799.1 MAG: general secretion pathway protein D [Candidatus Kentron sp. FM]VFK06163.1 MAG: general secretion pathway protein D [Candidatus Kentron sp. FM]
MKLPRAALLTWVILLVFQPGGVIAKPVTLNFQDADIGAVIGTVSNATGKNFLVDPRVKGKVTAISSQPIDQEELYQVFLSILEIHGFAAVPSGNVIKIIPNAIAKQTAIPTHLGSPPSMARDEVVTRVIQLEHVDASNVVPLLKPLMHQTGHAASVPGSNILILADRAANLERLIRVIHRIDKASNEKLEIIPLEHALAADVVKVLSSLQPVKAGEKSQGNKVTLIADDRTNSLLMGGEQAVRLRLRSIIAHLDMPLESGGNTQVIYLRYAKAKDLVPVLTGVLDEKKNESAKAVQPVFNIQADESTNALVITAPPAEMRVIREVIDKLDIRRAQVLVEAIIAEVSSDLGAELGVRWQTNTPSSGEFIGTAFTDVAELGTGLNLGFYRATDLRALLRVISNDTRSNVLSTPSLVTMDNEQAEIVVADNVPFITGEYTTSTSTDSTINPFRTIQREDVGLTLRVKPQINEGDTIKLDVEQEVSDVVASPEGASDLTTRRRSIKTSVLVEDGQLIVLGGLIDDDVSEVQSKVPLLGDVPLLGALFRFTRTETSKRNLMVFLHPRILRNVGTANIASYQKYNNVRAMQMELQKRGIPLIRSESPPLLLRLEDYLGGGRDSR